MLSALRALKLAKDSRGSVMVEFAICLPVLILMYLGAYTISDMISANRKVTIATRALADMVSRNISPTSVQANPSSTTISSSVASYMSASAVVMLPYDITQSVEQVSLLRVCDASHAWVVWTQAQTQTVGAAPSYAITSVPTTSNLTAGTLSSSSVISVPSSLITTPMLPVNSAGTTVSNCTAYGATTTTMPQLGTSGAYLYVGQIGFSYKPAISYNTVNTTPMADLIYMSPRLN